MLLVSTPPPPSSPPTPSSPAPLPLLTAKHTKYLVRSLSVLPSHTCSFDTSRMTIAFFGLCGLDLLQRKDLLLEHKERALEWIGRLYVISPDRKLAGFHGGTFLRSQETQTHLWPEAHYGHIAMTYTALACIR